MQGTEAEGLRAFKDAAAILRRRIEYLVSLPEDKVAKLAAEDLCRAARET